jgi:lysophospholipase L1-like esterase
MHRRILVSVLALAAVAALAGNAAAKTIKTVVTAPASRYYLALGDSLSQGQQPDLRGTSTNTNEGYADDLYATELKRIHSLQLVKLGCGGESTQSMITGKGNKDAAYYHCHPAGGSQLAAAKRFLKAHHRAGEVPLITIDIGANDIDGCASAADVGSCVTNGTNAIATDVPKILSAIKQAAPRGARLVAMNLYDPVLSGYFAPAGSTANALASASQGLLKSINDKLDAANQAAGFKTADVAEAFDSYAPFSDTVSWEGQQIPIAVARVCAWTWACSTPPSGPNIHANKNGYLAIADTFEKVIGRLS